MGQNIGIALIIAVVVSGFLWHYKHVSDNCNGAVVKGPLGFVCVAGGNSNANGG